MVAYYAQVDKVFRALADPSRRKLLDKLYADNGQAVLEDASPR